LATVSQFHPSLVHPSKARSHPLEYLVSPIAKFFFITDAADKLAKVLGKVSLSQVRLGSI
jgi:hypothetical protein